MKSLISIIVAFLLLTMVSGCKELDKLAELDEIERLLERMNAAHGGIPSGWTAPLP